MYVTSDLNIKSKTPLTSPLQVFKELPLRKTMGEVIETGRQAVREILDNPSGDRRLIVICGPCSIHNPEEALVYAKGLKELQEKVSDRILLLMRTYFEKPRTTVGWKGLLYDPDLNGTYNFEKGIRTARKLMLDIAEMGIASATEILDPITAQYVADCMSYAAIGARTTESQPHREFVSGLSMPTGFKNSTTGDIQVAIDAIGSSSSEHAFLGVLENGQTGVYRTTGNSHCHVILRGGNNSANFSSEWIAFVSEMLRKSRLPQNIVVDCSHANSSKVAKNQLKVVSDICSQIKDGNRSIAGVMIESNTCEGAQKVVSGQNLLPGVSITDACLGWEDTQNAIMNLYEALESRFNK